MWKCKGIRIAKKVEQNWNINTTFKIYTDTVISRQGDISIIINK